MSDLLTLDDVRYSAQISVIATLGGLTAQFVPFSTVETTGVVATGYAVTILAAVFLASFLRTP